ncbi:NAD(+)/NADH kinase [Candidatus Woesearchaeota archaeon]|nr:NAD(+)/NADH kinase [Candidatus Woesearchaeota archaeon]
MYYLTCKSNYESIELAKKVISYLKKKNLEFEADENIVGGKKISESNTDCILAVGDDNFILETFRSLGKKQIPLLGIASMQSFLAQSDAASFQQHIDLIERKKYNIQKKSRIVAKFNESQKYPALNDIGIFPAKSASLMRYSLNVNGNHIWKDSADGIIISTPTGSTGYTFSAHGPIILDEPEILSVTPIASLEKKTTVIVSDKSSIIIADVQASSPVVIMDGDVRVPLKSKAIEIEKSKYDALFIQFSKEYSIEKKLKKRTSAVLPSNIKGIPPSAKLIYKILTYEGNLTQKEIISATNLPERTVRYALELLLQKNMISQHPYLNDARQTVYGI